MGQQIARIGFLKSKRGALPILSGCKMMGAEIPSLKVQGLKLLNSRVEFSSFATSAFATPKP